MSCAHPRLAGRAVLVATLVLGSAGAQAQGGRTLTLEEALRTARERQPQLAAARAQVRVFQARVGEARAGYLPRVDASAQYQRSTANFVLNPSFARSPFASSLQIDNTLDTVNYYLFGATASELVYDFGHTGGTVEQARAEREAADADLETTVEAVALAVRVAYFNALAARELLQVGDYTVKNQAKHVEQIRQFVAAGTRPKIDLRSAELNLANAELQLVRARNGLDLAKVQLNAAMGVEGPIDYEVVAPPNGTDIADEARPAEELLDESLRLRPELRRAFAQERERRAARTVARAGYFPQFLASTNLSGAKVEDFTTTVNWYIGVGLSWNLLVGGATRKQVEEAEAGLDAATAQRELTRQNIRTELEQQLLAVGEAKQRLQVAERALSTGEERLRLAEGRYQAGAGDVLELDDAQVSFSNAQAQRVQAEYDLAISRARLEHAVGRK
jgi:outer membrane protein